MYLIARIIVRTIANGIALFAAAYWIPGFVLSVSDLESAAIVAGTLTLLNFFIKPILELILSPVIILTLGLGLIVVNAIILYVLDFLMPTLTIQTIPALLLAGILVGAVNLLFHLAKR